MKSIMSKISIIILSLLASTFTFAFDQGAVCAAVNAAVTNSAGDAWGAIHGPITDIVSRKTDGSDPRGEVCGSVWYEPSGCGDGGCTDGPHSSGSKRVCGQSGLECSGDTCHVNKEWGDCSCTSMACGRNMPYTAPCDFRCGVHYRPGDCPPASSCPETEAASEHCKDVYLVADICT
jgi:hypothetical protein